MLSFPLWFHVLFGFITGSLTASLGLVMVNIKPELKRVVLTGGCYALAVALVRTATLPFGAPFMILTLILVVITMLVWRLSLFKAVIVTIMGTLILSAGEAFFAPFSLKLLNVTISEMINNPFIAILFSLPQIIVSLIVIFTCLKFDLHILNFNPNRSGPIHLDQKRLVVVLGLVFTMLLLIIIQIVCNMTVFDINNANIVQTISLHNLGYITNITTMAVCFIVIILIVQFVELTEKESQYVIQAAYIDTIEELYTAIRAQNHDLVNHWQVLYGFIQMNNNEEAQKYLQELMGDRIVSHKYLSTGDLGLSALLYIKSGIALEEGIDFEVNIDEPLHNLPISSYELNRMIGNLINNAFDYVISRDDIPKKVQLRIFQDDNNQLMEIANSGYIAENMQEKIFEKGFSCKTGKHAGLGLYIVKELLEKWQGTIKVENREDMVVFTVCLPRDKLGGSYALSGAKNRGIAG